MDPPVSEAYGVWVEKRNDGTPSHGIERATFVIDADGTVATVMRRADPDAHASEALTVLAAASAQSG